MLERIPEAIVAESLRSLLPRGHRSVPPPLLRDRLQLPSLPSAVREPRKQPDAATRLHRPLMVVVVLSRCRTSAAGVRVARPRGRRTVPVAEVRLEGRRGGCGHAGRLTARVGRAGGAGLIITVEKGGGGIVEDLALRTARVAELGAPGEEAAAGYD